MLLVLSFVFNKNGLAIWDVGGIFIGNLTDNMETQLLSFSPSYLTQIFDNILITMLAPIY